MIGRTAPMIKWRLAGMALVVSTSLMFAAALPGRAGSTGNGTAGSGFPQYTYRADADKGCRGDTVVWGSSAHKGVYYVDGVGPQRIGVSTHACPL